jgi:phage tail P2-like protein
MSLDLLPSNALKSERALSLAARFSDDILPEDIKRLWRPNEAAERFLPYLAWGLHVDFWRDSLPDGAKRALISEAFQWHRLEGTFGAIRRICEAVFGETRVTAWHEYGGQPFSFRVTTEGRATGQNQEAWKELFEAIYLAKALRDWLDAIQIRGTARVTPRYGHGTVLCGGVTVRLFPKPPALALGCGAGLGLGLRGAMKIGPNYEEVI